VVRLRPAVGAHVTEGTTLGWVWMRDGSAFDPDDLDDLEDLVHDRVQLGSERTMQQDVGFGIRQMVEIGVKALSTGMNNPATAVESLANLSVVMCRLSARDLGSAVDADDGQRVRTMVPRLDFRGFLDLFADQLLRYGGDEPAVVDALLDVLHNIAEIVADTERKAAVRDQVDRVLVIAGRELDAEDLIELAQAGERIRATLDAGRRQRPPGGV
jgi:uncharacterized membrane protein